MLSLIAGLDLGEGLSRQAALLGADGERKSKEGQAGWPRGRIRRRGVLANKLATSSYGIYGGADVLQLGQMAGGCGENVIS